MATFRIALSNPGRKNEDGTLSVSIRLLHRRQQVFIPTPFRVFPSRVRKGEVADHHVVSSLTSRILWMQDETAKLGAGAESMTAKELKEWLLGREKSEKEPVKESGIDLLAFWRDEFLPTVKHPGTRGLYQTSLNSLVRFRGGSPLSTNSVNLRFLQDYEAWMERQGVGARGKNLYMTHLKKVFNTAKDLHNDEDFGKVVIPNDPFRKYKIPLPPAPKRTGDLTREQLLAIADWNPLLPGWRCGRMEQARDCFLLSFFLAGMNSADLYNAVRLSEDWTLEYERTKTRTRRADHALQRIHVPEFLRPLADKYRDRTGERVFLFHLRYANHKEFNRALNKGLKEVGKGCGIPGLYFYQARHSFATIAHNELRYSMEDVGKCLTHVPVMKVTAGYVREDYSIVDEVNKAVADYILQGRDCIFGKY